MGGKRRKRAVARESWKPWRHDSQRVSPGERPGRAVARLVASLSPQACCCSASPWAAEARSHSHRTTTAGRARRARAPAQREAVVAPPLRMAARRAPADRTARSVARPRRAVATSSAARRTNVSTCRRTVTTAASATSAVPSATTASTRCVSSREPRCPDVSGNGAGPFGRAPGDFGVEEGSAVSRQGQPGAAKAAARQRPPRPVSPSSRAGPRNRRLARGITAEYSHTRGCRRCTSRATTQTGWARTRKQGPRASAGEEHGRSWSTPRASAGSPGKARTFPGSGE